MASLFGKAQSISAPPKTAAGRKVKPETQIDGLQDLAEIDALIKALGGLKTTLEQEIKQEAFDLFYAKGKELKARPENLKAVDGNATASIEFRKRATSSPLSPAEIEMFTEAGIFVDTIVTTQKLFGVNPKYATDEPLLEKVSKAIERIVPEDFFVVQDEVSKTVVADRTVDEAFAKEANSSIIGALSVLSIKPKLSDVNIKSIIDHVRKLLNA